MPDSLKLHLIGNAHIDPVWLWPWQEGYQEVLASFRSALDRMKEYPDFQFAASSAVFYSWVEETDPAMFAEIRQRVEEGRWELTGGWWVEPDCNVPGGEALARHALYAQRYLREKFGKMATVGFNIDSFGHPGSFPQILRQSGLDSYTFLRPGPHERNLPGPLFWWESDDGARVLASRIPFTYCHWDEMAPHVERCRDVIQEPATEGMCWYGVGNHGGGPTIKLIEQIHELQRAGESGAELVLSTPGAFFRSVREKNWQLPVVHEELLNHAKGCYSVHAGIKTWNRRAENSLSAAEKWSAAAQFLDVPYPAEAYRRAWKQVLFNQFHDSLAGTSLPEAYVSARNGYGEALAIAETEQNRTLQKIAWNIAIPQEEGALPLVAFNSLSWPAQANLEIEAFRWDDDAVLLDENDRAIPWQRVQSHSAASRARLSFNAELPALGYRTFRLVPGKGDASVAAEPLEAGETWLDNGLLRVEVNPQDGTLASLRDLRSGTELLAGAGARGQVLDDPGDTWAHGFESWQDEIGSFGAARVNLVEQGPVKATLRAVSFWGGSELIQDFTLYPGRPWVDVRVRVNWQEQYRMLKLRFPLAVRNPSAARDYVFGWGEIAPDGSEFPQHTWASLSGEGAKGPAGLSLANDSRYSLDVTGSDLGLTVLRSPAFAHHIPDVPREDGLYEYIDQGWQEFRYRLIPHGGDPLAAGTVQLAAELNHPAVLQFSSFHPNGRLPQSDSWLACEPASLLVTALKQAEDGEGMIVRAWESSRQPQEGIIRLGLWEREIRASFKPCEVKSFFVPRDPAQPVREVNFLEDEVSG